MRWTIFATAKDFEGHFGIIQTNAIRSWSRLSPRPDILLFGEARGQNAIATEVSATVVRKVARSDRGTPLLNDMFEMAQHSADTELLCYSNADAILPSVYGFIAQRLAAIHKPYLAVAGTQDINVQELLALDTPPERELRSRIPRGRGGLWGSEVLLFPNGAFKGLPELIVGRGCFDGWMMREARRRNYSLIDVSRMSPVLHQAHDYSHLLGGQLEAFDGDEARYNRAQAGDASYSFLLDATHYLIGDRLVPAWDRAFCRFVGVSRTWYVLTTWHRARIRLGRLRRVGLARARRLALSWRSMLTSK